MIHKMLGLDIKKLIINFKTEEILIFKNDKLQLAGKFSDLLSACNSDEEIELYFLD